MLYCSGCKQNKPVGAFARNRSRTRGYQHHCKNCFRERFRKSDPLKNRKRHVRRYYGLNWDQYTGMYYAQNGCCAICERPLLLYERDKINVAHLDHDHSTGAMRELLCHGCNAGLGYFRDKADLLRRAAKYIDHHSKAHPDQGKADEITGGTYEQVTSGEVVHGMQSVTGHGVQESELLGFATDKPKEVIETPEWNSELQLGNDPDDK